MSAGGEQEEHRHSDPFLDTHWQATVSAPSGVKQGIVIFSCGYTELCVYIVQFC